MEWRSEGGREQGRRRREECGLALNWLHSTLSNSSRVGKGGTSSTLLPQATPRAAAAASKPMRPELAGEEGSALAPWCGCERRSLEKGVQQHQEGLPLKQSVTMAEDNLPQLCCDRAAASGWTAAHTAAIAQFTRAAASSADMGSVTVGGAAALLLWSRDRFLLLLAAGLAWEVPLNDA